MLIILHHHLKYNFIGRIVAICLFIYCIPSRPLGNQEIHEITKVVLAVNLTHNASILRLWLGGSHPSTPIIHLYILIRFSSITSTKSLCSLVCHPNQTKPNQPDHPNRDYPLHLSISMLVVGHVEDLKSWRLSRQANFYNHETTKYYY